MATSTQIINLALRSIGVKRITAISDSVESARVMNDLYDLCRDDYWRLIRGILL